MKQASRAVEKAEQATEYRLESMNEFRDQLRDQASTFVTREYIDEQMRIKEIAHSAISDRIGRTEQTLSRIIGGLILVSFMAPIISGIIAWLVSR